MRDRPLVLVVEDDAGNVGALELALREAGYRCDHAGNGYGALVRMAVWRPDLILLDRYMPGMDGMAFLRELRANQDWRKIPVVMLTAASGDVVAAMEEEVRAGLGPGLVLRKPCPLPDLLAVLPALLGEGG